MRKKILYIDRLFENIYSSETLNIRKKKIDTLIEFLDPYFDVSFRPDLNKSNVYSISRSLKTKINYDALITCFPYDKKIMNDSEIKNINERYFVKKLYEESSCLIKKIKAAAPDIQILAYECIGQNSSSSLIAEIMIECGVSDFVCKSGNIEEDARKIREKLNRLFSHLPLSSSLSSQNPVF